MSRRKTLAFIMRRPQSITLVRVHLLTGGVTQISYIIKSKDSAVCLLGLEVLKVHKITVKYLGHAKGLTFWFSYQLSSSHNTIRRLYEFLVIAYGHSNVCSVKQLQIYGWKTELTLRSSVCCSCLT